MTAQTLLAIDTATPACSVALKQGGKVIHETVLEARKHTEVLLPMCDRLLTQSGAKVEGIILSAGPGAFTGLRVGASVALGLATAWNAPILPISSLALLAASAANDDAATVLALLDARMHAVYAGLYRVDASGVATLAPDRLCAPDAIPADWYTQADIIAGSGLVYAQSAFAQVPRAMPDMLPDARHAFLPMHHAVWQSACEPLDLFYLRNDITQS
ncbi:MAG: tRNA (adenosine(37)-N6)-threonylcarbamoyltransferase complex dimerization subunit type 1 TsaB [Cardiobacteriaceae bacterium]|nr:tRNA (adenosine(37)-N6)-threonylcarbamoyltransferase complex dimerization subunit type 1 TsaB [Cardiobacteriaceae bacterium]